MINPNAYAKKVDEAELLSKENYQLQAQLREMFDLIMEGSHNWHILYNKAARYKAQQLSGRELYEL